MSKQIKFNSIEEAIEDIKNGKMIVVVDDEDRENEGDIIVAAEKVTPECINFMATYAKGLICMPIIGERLDELEISNMVIENTDNHETAFTISIDHKDTTTGISAYERALTIQKILKKDTNPKDLRRPGHIFPLRYKNGGVLRRAGHTEATVDLARVAGFYPAGICCEIMNDDGTMARVPQLMDFCSRHNLKIITIADLIKYLRKNENLIEKVTETHLPTKFGDFKLLAFEDKLTEDCHVALLKGDVSDGQPVLVRVHSECLTGDVLGSLRCDCGDQLAAAMENIEKEGKGILLYMRQEGRGIGLKNKLLAYNLQEKGLDTVEANEALGFKADLRDYGIGAQILTNLGVKKIRLMTNNPRKIAGLEGYGLEIVERSPLEIHPCSMNIRYLSTKKTKLGHLLKEVPGK